MGIVEQLVKGRDGVIRVAKLRTNKTEIERAIQLLYPLELSCDSDTQCMDGDTQCMDGDTQCMDGDTQCLDGDTQCRDGDTQCKDLPLDPRAKEFNPRRRAAKIAEDNVKQTFLYEDEQS